MMLIPAGVVAFVSICATLVMLAQRNFADAFTRSCVSVFYLVLAVLPVQIEVARELNRWFWVLVLGMEVFWWGAMVVIKRWRKP